MVIIGLLAGFVGPRFFAQIGKSEVKTARAQIDALGKALDQYRLDVGRYPSSDEGLAALNERPASDSKWSGPYLKKGVPLDAFLQTRNAPGALYSVAAVPADAAQTPVFAGEAATN